MQPPSADEIRERLRTIISKRLNERNTMTQIGASIGVSATTIHRWNKGDRLDNVLTGAIALYLSDEHKAA